MSGPLTQKATPKSPSFALHADAQARDLERRLHAIWAEILERSSFGVTDNFYEAGGDSLKAVSLIASIEAEFGISLSSTQLYDAMTIEKQAGVVLQESGPPEATGGERPLFEIRPGASSPPFFCFPGDSGLIANFQPLVERLDPSQGVQIVLYSELEGGGTPPPMEQFASSCLQAIRRVQPAGPYRLGGYCFGASLAYEVAQQLRAAGEEVAMLALFGAQPGIASWSVPQRMAYRGKQFTAWLRSFFVRRPRTAGLQPGSPQRGEDRDVVPDKVARIQTAAHPILQNYRHRRFDGRILLFCPERGGEEFDPEYWRKLVGGLEIFSIPGNHFAMLREPNVSILAEILQERLAGA